MRVFFPSTPPPPPKSRSIACAVSEIYIIQKPSGYKIIIDTTILADRNEEKRNEKIIIPTSYIIILYLIPTTHKMRDGPKNIRNYSPVTRFIL